VDRGSSWRVGDPELLDAAARNSRELVSGATSEGP
jgi:hypothetical protein